MYFGVFLHSPADQPGCSVLGTDVYVQPSVYGLLRALIKQTWQWSVHINNVCENAWLGT
jgi:hypothetical protein